MADFGSAAPALLETKLYVPWRRPGNVSRPRLVGRLNERPGRKLTLVSAPAGFGKTTLLVESLAGAPAGEPPPAWVSLDPGDNDPAVFWAYVVSDNVSAASGVAEYFLKNGRRALAVVGGPADVSSAAEREQGFLEAIHRQDPKLTVRHVEGQFSYEGGRKAAETLMEDFDECDAIFCVNDLSALGVLDAVRSAGARVPEDIWVVGFSDMAMASWPSYDLTTVRQRIGQMTETAVAMLSRRIGNHDTKPEVVLLDTELIVRGSTAHTSIA